MNSRKIFSFVLPQTIIKGCTALGQKYEVVYENGLKVLNSENANYSFGSLHQIMQKGLDEVFKLHKPDSILMLGLGGGSALSILRNKCKWPYNVTAVEIDEELIQLAKEHFDLGSHHNVQMVTGDAEKVIWKLKEGSFDLVIDDIFWDNNIPDFCLQKDYLNRNLKLLKSGGIYMRNTMKTDAMDHKSFELSLSEVFSEFYSVKHPVFENKIYFCQV